MGYIDSFYEMEKNDPHSRLYSIRLSRELSKQIYQEIRGTIGQRIKEPYVEERLIAGWMPHLDSTLHAKLFRKYFSPRAKDTNNIPEDGALLVANHSGMWGFDVACAAYALFNETGCVTYAVMHKIFNGSDAIKTVGGLLGDHEVVRELLEDGKRVLVCPGGAEEVAKPYTERYKMKRVHGFAPGNYGYLIVATLANKPIVPVGIIGAEETHIHLGDMKESLKKIVDPVHEASGLLARGKGWLDKVKACPAVLNPVPFPSTIDVVVGEPLPVHEELGDFPCHRYNLYKKKAKMANMKKEERKEFEELDAILYDVNEEVLNSLQHILDTRLKP